MLSTPKWLIQAAIAYFSKRRKKVAGFVIVGTITTLLGKKIVDILIESWGWSPIGANLITTTLMLLLGFFLSYQFVWGAKMRASHAGLSLLAFVLFKIFVSLPLNTAAFTVVISISQNYNWAYFGAIAAVMTVNFFVSEEVIFSGRLFSIRRRKL